jgi:hypothetical protein
MTHVIRIYRHGGRGKVSNGSGSRGIDAGFSSETNCKLAGGHP